MATIKHKHAEFIHAWANGADIEYKSKVDGVWCDHSDSEWDVDYEYRIKPTPRPQWQQDLIDAAKAGKVVEFGRGTWIESDLNTKFDDYDFGAHIKDEYRIRPEKVTRYLWARMIDNGFYQSNTFLSDAEALKEFNGVYKRLDWSATEFEE